jgi:hypothetical protein
MSGRIEVKQRWIELVAELIRRRARRALRSLALSQGRLRGDARLAQIFAAQKRLLRMTIKLHHYCFFGGTGGITRFHGQGELEWSQRLAAFIE